MSKTLRKILGEAYKFIGLAPNGILNDGQVGDGVDFANEVIRKYNESSLFPFTFSTVEGTVSNGILHVSSYDDGESIVGDAPVGMAAVYWKRGDTDMIPLKDCDYKDIFQYRNSSASPLWYSIVVESDERATLNFDALGEFRVLLVYPKKFPHLEIEDVFNGPEIYEQVVKYGVAVLAATKASLEESVIAGYQKQLDDAVRAIRKGNASKRPVRRKMGGGYNRHVEFNNPSWR